MSKEAMRRILDKIREYDRIFIFRHIRNDGDCVGSTKGLKEILKLSFPEKEIFLIDNEQSQYLAFLGGDDPEMPDEAYNGALGIVLDTATLKRVSNQKCQLCKELIKIDHHIPVDAYGDLEWVAEEKSSTCEMIAEFYHTFRDELKINQAAATYLYTGMVTDSGRFQYSSTSGNTLRMAGMLLDQGIDTDVLYANLYLKEFEYLKFKAHVLENMGVTENGVAYIQVTTEMKERFHLSNEDASAVVSFLDSIKGCICWVALIETGDEEQTIRVRLRSRFVPIHTVAEQYRGGGHACACGATVYGQGEVQALLAAADAVVKEYKQTHEGWL